MYSLISRGAGISRSHVELEFTRRFSCRKMFWHKSVQLVQMYTVFGPSTIGPTSRLVLPQNEQVVTFRPLNVLSV
jgi:hypothetical protein